MGDKMGTVGYSSVTFLLIMFRYTDIINRKEEEAMVERLLKKQNMTGTNETEIDRSE